jgi:(R,R)-butanediol dehydrogenase / meso-butanediol dehydrogenase / diacetyl reductase
MHAAIVRSTESIELIDVPSQELGPHDVRVRVARTGLCGSDIHAFLGTHPFRKPPMILGHEAGGYVAEIGPEVTRVRVGDLVAVEPQLVCGECGPCRRGATNVCRRKIVLGTTPWPGSLADETVVPESVAYPMPPSCTPTQAALVEPLAVGVHAARVAAIEPGERVVVIGAGPIGFACASSALQAGAGSVLAIDPQSHNLVLARRAGAAAVATPGEAETLARDLFAGEGADVVFIGIGKSVAVEQGLRLLRKGGGRVVVVALFDEPITLSDPFQLVGAEAAILGSQMYTAADFKTAVDLTARGRVDLRPLVSHEVPLGKVGDAFRLLIDRTGSPVKVHVVSN